MKVGGRGKRREKETGEAKYCRRQEREMMPPGWSASFTSESRADVYRTAGAAF